MGEPIRLYWWQDTTNFGDRISPEIVAHVSGRDVEHAGPREADLFAVGSLMVFVRRGHNAPREGEKAVIWGTGSAGPHRMDFRDNVEFAAVRGPLTAALLERTGLAYGDPGLLLPKFVKVGKRTDRIGLVLHHSQRADEDFLARLEADGRFDLIDPKDDDHMEVVRRIATCRHVFSSSLHGLVVADAYGVPNTWVDPGGIHSTPRFKFYDYALAVGRVLDEPVPRDAIFDFKPGISFRRSLPYADGIARAQAALEDSFPERLRA